jgi:hypothetical protein
METRSVDEGRWVEFFDGFSRDHFGWPVTVTVLDGDRGPQHLAQDLPLQGISFDKTGSRACAIEINVGRSPAAHVNHVIDMPLRIHKAEEFDGSVDLEIEPANGPKTLVHVGRRVH